MCELTHGMAGERHGRGTAWARQGHGMLCVNPPYFACRQDRLLEIAVWFSYLGNNVQGQIRVVEGHGPPPPPSSHWLVRN